MRQEGLEEMTGKRKGGGRWSWGPPDHLEQPERVRVVRHSEPSLLRCPGAWGSGAVKTENKLILVILLPIVL